MKNTLHIILCLIFSSCYSFAQDTIETFLEQKLENIAESSQNEEDDYANLLEALTYYKKHPINLNNTSKAELLELGLLDELQAENLVKHIEKNGKLISKYELQSIDGYDLLTIEKILPYIKVADISDQPHVSVKEIITNGNHQFIFRSQQVLEDQTGFSEIDSAGIIKSPNSRYIGSKQKLYARYRFNFGTNVSAGITAEKDAGELFFKKNNKFDYPYYDSLLNGKQKNGFDFYSAHFFVRNIRFIKALAIGDFQAGFGQGLTAWSGLAYGKTSDAVNIKRNQQGIRPYSSVDENLFMRGGGVTVGTNTLQITGFYSQKKIDANITLTDSLNETEEVSSLQTTGLHTTPSEIADKDAITEIIYGGNISYRKRKYSFGLTGTQTSFSAELKRDLSTYSQFEFTEKQLVNFGADYSVLVRNMNFFGEAAVSDNGGVGFLNGCIAALDPKFSLAVLHRNFQRNYQSLFANAFAENTKPTNEQGIYIGITAKPVKFISINAYYDQFSFPWLKYQVDAPSTGSEWLVQLNYTPNKKFDTYARVKQKDKFTTSNVADEIDFIVPFRQTNYRWHVGYQISPSLKLRNRIEYIVLGEGEMLKQVQHERENGYMIYQDVAYKKMGSKISFAFRYALFDTKTYDSRIYAYETDIPGSFSIPSYYYKGSRTYLMLNYDITRWAEVWVRWSQTYYSNKNIISEGSLSEIKGNTKSEVKVQLKVKF